MALPDAGVAAGVGVAMERLRFEMALEESRRLLRIRRVDVDVIE